jgi:hypothetical protein
MTVILLDPAISFCMTDNVSSGWAFDLPVRLTRCISLELVRRAILFTYKPDLKKVKIWTNPILSGTDLPANPFHVIVHGNG